MEKKKLIIEKEKKKTKNATPITWQKKEKQGGKELSLLTKVGAEILGGKTKNGRWHVYGEGTAFKV